METEKLNEYIFASLLAAEARLIWKSRRVKMMSNGASEEELDKMFITDEDYQQAFSNLELFRSKSLSLVKS